MAKAKTKGNAMLFVVKRDKDGIHAPKQIRKNVTQDKAIEYAVKHGEDQFDCMHLLLQNGELFVLINPAPDGYMWEPCNP